MNALTQFLKKPNQEKVTLLKEKGKSKLNSHGYLFLCMLIPALLMYLIYLAREIHPFGDGAVLVLDLNAQYVWFFEALRNFVHGDASLLYSFSRALGGEFLGMYAYYIASPLSYIVCLFPQDRMLEALLTLFLIKTALCGGTFGYYMHKTFKSLKPFPIIAFSTLYALTSYAIVQQHNTMWIDAVMWLPLITLGLEALIKHGKFKMYTAFLALTLFSNFYIGYMVCIYCFLYFFYYYFSNDEAGRNNPLKEAHHFLKSLLRVAFYSILAVGMAMLILLSAYYALNFGKTTFSDPKWLWTFNFDILDLLYKFLPGSYDTVRPEGYPFVYCGILTLLLIPAYFLSKKQTMCQKIFAGAFVLVFIASFSLSIPDLLWHGFQKPNWLNYRYSFMLCFFLCVLACRAFADFERISLKVTLATGGFLALICVMLQKYSDDKYVKPDDFTCIWFSLIMIFVYLAILGTLRTAKDKQVVCVVLVAAISIEVFLNGLWSLNSLDKDVVYSKYSTYNNFLNDTRPIVEQVQASDPSWYRMEKTHFRTTNDNMALKIRGLSGSTSTLNKETIQFLNKMGYASSSHWSKYLGGTPVNDSLLGIKYIVSDNPIYQNYYESVATHSTENDKTYTAYKNPYALSLAYGVDEDLLNFRLGYTNVIPEETEQKKDENKEKESPIGDVFNQLKSVLNGWLDIDETINSSTYIDDYKSPFERLNAMITAMLGEEETVQIFVPVETDETITSNVTVGSADGHHSYKKTDTSKTASVAVMLTMPEDNELFFYMPSKYPREVKLSLSVDGTSFDKGTFFGGETSRIISLGQRTAGSNMKLTMTLTGNDFYTWKDQPAFYYIDWAVFEDAMARLAKDQYQITEYTEDSMNGTFTASKEHELVMTTLAYDKGWKVYVDGEQVETYKVLGSLVAFYIDGAVGETHTLKLIYRPNTFIIGLTISLISLGIFVLIIIFEKKLRAKRGVRLLVGVPVIEGEPIPTESDGESPPMQDDAITPEEMNIPELPQETIDTSDEEDSIGKDS